MPTSASHVWKPSVARIITLDAFVAVPRGTIPSVPSTPSWPLKDPADLLDYEFDISPALIGNDGDAISTLDVTITPANPGDLALASATADGTRAVLCLLSCQSGTTYTVTLTIGTQAGRTINRSVALPVASLSTLTNPLTLTTNSGSPLTDQNGNPILAGP